MNIKEFCRAAYTLAISNDQNPCGSGSDGKLVVEVGTVDYIKNLVARYNIVSVNDSPCGVYNNWMNLVDLPNMGVKYVGYDVNDLVIERNKKEHPELEFIESNICEDPQPKCDLIICRDFLFHLPNQLVINTLNNFKKAD